jgi:hypothetical protein
MFRPTFASCPSGDRRSSGSRTSQLSGAAFNRLGHVAAAVRDHTCQPFVSSQSSSSRSSSLRSQAISAEALQDHVRQGGASVGAIDARRVITHPRIAAGLGDASL